MANQSLYKNSKKILRKTKNLYYKSVESQQCLQAMKTLEFQSKLHGLIENSESQDPAERLKQLDIDDIPLEAMQKWVMQMNTPAQQIHRAPMSF